MGADGQYGVFQDEQHHTCIRVKVDKSGVDYIPFSSTFLEVVHASNREFEQQYRIELTDYPVKRAAQSYLGASWLARSKEAEKHLSHLVGAKFKENIPELNFQNKESIMTEEAKAADAAKTAEAKKPETKKVAPPALKTKPAAKAAEPKKTEAKPALAKAATKPEKVAAPAKAATKPATKIAAPVKTSKPEDKKTATKPATKAATKSADKAPAKVSVKTDKPAKNTEKPVKDKPTGEWGSGRKFSADIDGPRTITLAKTAPVTTKLTAMAESKTVAAYVKKYAAPWDILKALKAGHITLSKAAA